MGSNDDGPTQAIDISDLDVAALKDQIDALKGGLIATSSIISILLGAFCARKYEIFGRIANLIPNFNALGSQSVTSIPMTIDERPQTAQTLVDEDGDLSQEEEPLVSIPRPILPSEPAVIMQSESMPALESDNQDVEIGKYNGKISLIEINN